MLDSVFWGSLGTLSDIRVGTTAPRHDTAPAHTFHGREAQWRAMKRGSTEHPKLYKLSSQLKSGRPRAIGYLELLWAFTAKYTPAGDIGRYTDAQLEAAMDWTGRPGVLVQALIDCQWIDIHSKWRLAVHHWGDHADEAIKKRFERAGKSFVSFQQDTDSLSGQCPDNVGQCLPLSASRARVAEPSRAEPSRAAAEPSGSPHARKPASPTQPGMPPPAAAVSRILEDRGIKLLGDDCERIGLTAAALGKDGIWAEGWPAVFEEFLARRRGPAIETSRLVVKLAREDFPMWCAKNQEAVQSILGGRRGVA